MSMKTLDLPEEALREKWGTLVKEGDTGVAKTIAQQSPVETFKRQSTLGNLPRIDVDRDVNEFDIKRTIGQGSMGLVRLARQRSLWRDVAIKTILPELLETGISTLTEAGSDASETGDDARAAVYRLFAECRFGYEQALTVWENNTEAKSGLHRALKMMIDVELHQRDDKSAALLLDELPGDHPEFQRHLDALRRELEQEAEEAQRNKQFIRDIDISLASRQRSIMCIFLGFIFGGAPFLVELFVHLGLTELTFQSYFGQFAGVIVGTTLVVGLMRDRLLQNAINARLIFSIFVILGGCLIMRVLGYLLGLDPGGAIALENGLLAFAMAMLALSIDKRMWPAGVAFLLGGIGGAIYPEYILPFDGASNAIAIWIIAFVWREPAQNHS